uniref:Uncharacterized protein n=1 Tax=Arundo donax TaxID=35708 RepID=A0A0A9FPT8_ARUDO
MIGEVYGQQELIHFSNQ